MGDPNLLATCHLNFFTPRLLSLSPFPFWIDGLCTLLHFLPRRLITSKEPLKLIS